MSRCTWSYPHSQCLVLQNAFKKVAELEGATKRTKAFEDKQFKLIDDCLRSRAGGRTWPENGCISVDNFLCNHSSCFQYLCHLCLFVWILNLYDICKRFGSLVENSWLRKKFEPHKVMLINIVAMVAYVLINCFLCSSTWIYTLVSYHSLSLAYTNSFCVGMLEDFDTNNLSWG